MSFWLEALCGQTLLSLDSEGKEQTVETSSLKGKHIGLYFSAHWCRPCRAFTPALAALHKKLNSDGKAFDIVFVSSDKVEAEFSEYLAEMPWKATPFSKPQISRALMGKYGIMGIPALIILSPSGELVTRGGVQAAKQDPEGADFPWPGSSAGVGLPVWVYALICTSMWLLFRFLVFPAITAVFGSSN